MAENYFHGNLELFDLLIENNTKKTIFFQLPKDQHAVPDPELASISINPLQATGLEPLPPAEKQHNR